MEKALVVGSVSNGKTSFTNSCAKDSFFTTGKCDTGITKKFQSVTLNEIMLKLIDSPPFGPDEEMTLNFLKNLKKIFLDLTYFDQYKNELPFNKLILVNKFEKIFEEENFLKTAEIFYRIFGFEGLNNLIIVCIQPDPNLRYGNNDFEVFFKNTNAYKFLLEKNNQKQIKYCNWDNYYAAFSKQYDNLEILLTELEGNDNQVKFDSRAFLYLKERVDDLIEIYKKK